MSTDNNPVTDLIAAQAACEPVVKDAVNPHFRSQYASLGSCLDACRRAFHENNFAILQICGQDERGKFVLTRLQHTSGEQYESRVFLVLSKQDMQGLGSAITYARRYGLLSVAGLAPEDDDGNGSTQRTERNTVLPEPKIKNKAEARLAFGGPAIGHGKPTEEFPTPSDNKYNGDDLLKGAAFQDTLINAVDLRVPGSGLEAVTRVAKLAASDYGIEKMANADKAQRRDLVAGINAGKYDDAIKVDETTQIEVEVKRVPVKDLMEDLTVEQLRKMWKAKSGATNDHVARIAVDTYCAEFYGGKVAKYMSRELRKTFGQAIDNMSIKFSDYEEMAAKEIKNESG